MARKTEIENLKESKKQQLSRKANSWFPLSSAKGKTISGNLRQTDVLIESVVAEWSETEFA